MNSQKFNLAGINKIVDNSIKSLEWRSFKSPKGYDLSSDNSNTISISTQGDDLLLLSHAWLDIEASFGVSSNRASLEGITVDASNQSFRVTDNAGALQAAQNLTIGNYESATEFQAMIQGLIVANGADYTFNFDDSFRFRIILGGGANGANRRLLLSQSLAFALGFDIFDFQGINGGITFTATRNIKFLNLPTNIDSLFRSSKLYANNILVNSIEYPFVQSTILHGRSVSNSFVKQRKEEGIDFVDNNTTFSNQSLYNTTSFYDNPYIIDATNQTFEVNDGAGALVAVNIATGTYSTFTLLEAAWRAVIPAGSGNYDLIPCATGTFQISVANVANRSIRLGAFGRYLGFTVGQSNLTVSFANNNLLIAENISQTYGKVYKLKIPLVRHFKWLESYDKCTRGIKWTVELERQKNMSEVIKSAQSISSGASVKINKIQMFIPCLKSSPTVEALILDDITKKSKTVINYENSQVYRRLEPPSTNYTWFLDDARKTPKQVFFCMQSQSQLDDITSTLNPCTFINNNMRSCELRVNKLHTFPKMPYELHFGDPTALDEQRVIRPYLDYMQSKVHEYDNGGNISIAQYDNAYPIICFDVSREQKVIDECKEQGAKLEIHVELAQNPASSVYMIALVVYDDSVVLEGRQNRIIFSKEN